MESRPDKDCGPDPYQLAESLDNVYAMALDKRFTFQS